MDCRLARWYLPRCLLSPPPPPLGSLVTDLFLTEDFLGRWGLISFGSDDVLMDVTGDVCGRELSVFLVKEGGSKKDNVIL